MTEPVLVLPRKAYARSRHRWLAERRRGIGGSDAAAVLGLSPWASPLSTWVDKTRPSDDDRSTEAMEWGAALEDVIARRGAAKHGLRIGPCPGILAHPARLWQRVTVDRYIVGRDRKPYGLVECKNVTAYKDDEWDETGPPPTHVVLQVQHGLDVTGFDVGHVLALVGGNRLRHWEIGRDDALIGMLRAGEAAFWALVEAGTPPATIGHDADFDALAALYPDGSDDQVALNGDMVSRLRLRAQLKAEIKDNEATVKAIDAAVLQALGDARYGVNPDEIDRKGNLGRVVTVVRGQWTGLDQTRLWDQHPDAYTDCQITRPKRPYLLPARQKETAGAAT